MNVKFNILILYMLALALLLHNNTTSTTLLSLRKNSIFVRIFAACHNGNKIHSFCYPCHNTPYACHFKIRFQLSLYLEALYNFYFLSFIFVMVKDTYLLSCLERFNLLKAKVCTRGGKSMLHVSVTTETATRGGI